MIRTSRYRRTRARPARRDHTDLEDRMARYRLTMLGVGLVATVALAGCQAKSGGSGGLSAAGPATAASSAPATTAPAPATVPSTAPSTPSTGTTPVTAPPTGGSKTTSGAFASEVAAAKAQWKAGAKAISADQGLYWIKAATDLAGAGTTYIKQVGELTELATLPDAQQTSAENAEYHKDIDALNSFFGTPGLYG
jgi:hypothetical protein